MKFVDKAIIKLKAGHGGPGAKSFRREKYVPKGGPSGGNGGSGGNIIFKTSSKKQTLMDLKIKKSYDAPSGKPGANKNRSGPNGKDIIITVPCGTMVLDLENNLVADLTENHYEFIAAKGGKGGLGNANFASSKRQTPTYAQPGLAGEEKDYKLELRLIAEVGLIGLPNAGKSTLLKTLTYAHPKIASYPFTTLFPNLGVLKFYDQEIVLADIPGLIKGASKGQGLGFDFLRHIDRTKLLVHLIDVTDRSPEVCWENYQIVLRELKLSEIDIANKKISTVLSKIDMTDTKQLDNIVKYFNLKGINVFKISAFSKEGITELCWHIKNSCDVQK